MADRNGIGTGLLYTWRKQGVRHRMGRIARIQHKTLILMRNPKSHCRSIASLAVVPVELHPVWAEFTCRNINGFHAMRRHQINWDSSIG